MFTNSSINWCEKDYDYTNYIAEFWNTLSGVFLCISAYYCFVQNRQRNMNKLYYANFLLLIVGLGTMMFHGTLIFFWQLFDEIPMLLIIIEYYNILLNLELTQKIQLFKINNSLLCALPLPIILSYYIYPPLHVIFFQSVITMSVSLIIYTIYNININLHVLFYNSYVNTYVNSYAMMQPPSYFYVYNIRCELLKKYNMYGFGLLMFSLVIWNIDSHFCEHTGYLELHALWHISSALGMYYANEIIYLFIEINTDLQKLEKNLKM